MTRVINMTWTFRVKAGDHPFGEQPVIIMTLLGVRSLNEGDYMGLVSMLAA